MWELKSKYGQDKNLYISEVGISYLVRYNSDLSFDILDENELVLIKGYCVNGLIEARDSNGKEFMLFDPKGFSGSFFWENQKYMMPSIIKSSYPHLGIKLPPFRLFFDLNPNIYYLEKDKKMFCICLLAFTRIRRRYMAD